MAPKGLPPASNQHKFQLTEDDEKELQQFWKEPQEQPEDQQSLPSQQYSAPPDDGLPTMPFGDDVDEEVVVEEFEEELPDGTIRKVIRKRIKR
ncbi:hypothetical protein, partial [Salmonella sp. s55962]|uniref:hypothetical protein n=1 Tax=Salmonella sp. s55962 TaxID=3159685 RepID=UPI003981878D